MSDSNRDVDRLLSLRREAEKIVRELFHPEEFSGASGFRLVADLVSEGDSYVIEVEIPGVNVSDLAVLAVGDVVMIEGTKEACHPDPALKPAYERAERSYGPFRRVFDLPGPSDLSRARASLSNGLLRIWVPRIADRRGRRRSVRVSVVGDS